MFSLIACLTSFNLQGDICVTSPLPKGIYSYPCVISLHCSPTPVTLCSRCNGTRTAREGGIRKNIPPTPCPPRLRRTCNGGNYKRRSRSQRWRVDYEGYTRSCECCSLTIQVQRIVLTRFPAQLSNDPTLSSLPLLSTFLKSYSRPYLGITSPAAAKQIPSSSEPGTLSSATTANAINGNTNGSFPELAKEEDEFVEREVRDRFKKMSEGYFDNVCKKLVIEHNVSSDMISVQS